MYDIRIVYVFLDMSLHLIVPGTKQDKDKLFVIVSVVSSLL